jgi:cell division septum initiation protein DivIVA
MTDNWMKGRVKGMLAGTATDNEPQQYRDVQPDAVQHQALQVLTLAQRTADEHIAGAHQQADKILADARVKAEQIVGEAKTHAEAIRRDADKALSEARATAAQTAREAQTHGDNARRNADKVVSDARRRAEEVAKDAQTKAEELKRQAEQRYQDVVGSLASKREALQQQIEALEQFDRDYRARLTSFMQGQLRALWVDQPQVNAEIEQPTPAAKTAPIPTQQPRSAETTRSRPNDDHRDGATGVVPDGPGQSAAAAKQPT